MENHVGDLDFVSHFGSGSPCLDRLEEACIVRRYASLGVNHDGLIPQRKILTHVHKLGIHQLDEVHFRSFAEPGTLLQVYRPKLRNKLRLVWRGGRGFSWEQRWDGPVC